jgi:transcriptional regulator with XRE-family HTH domain
MPSYLRHTQTNVNARFASYALPRDCVPGKIVGMRILLSEIRGERRLEDIADALDVVPSTVQRWEKGTMAIPSLRLPEIAEAYGCAVTDIFAEDEPAPPMKDVVSVWTRIPLRDRLQAKTVLETFASRTVDEG